MVHQEIISTRCVAQIRSNTNTKFATLTSIHGVYKLTLIKLIIQPFVRQQILMLALLDNAPILNDTDQIRIDNRAQAVRNHDDGTRPIKRCVE